ncbi:glycine betaine ABC transporter substrate-binding protein [Chloroflexota bacterium]
MKRKFMFSLLLLVMALSLVIPGCAEKEEKHVIFATGAWTADWMTIYPVKIMLEEELGYTTELVDTTIPMAWASVASGEAHLWTNGYLPNQEDLQAKFADEVVELGIMYGGGPHDPCLQFWAVPTWVSEQYGITSVADLENPDFVEMFDLDGDGVGDILGCDASWKCAAMNDQMIIDYGFEGIYEQKYGAEGMMTAAIDGYMKKNEPVLFYFYTPHPLFVRYPVGESITVLEDPLGSWGGYSTIIKVGNKGWVEANPEAAELIRRIKVTQDAVAWSMAEIEVRGDDDATLTAIAKEWMAEHQAEVDSWVAAVK